MLGLSPSVFLSEGYWRQEGVRISLTMSSRASRTIYVGNLPGDVREREIEDLFYKVLCEGVLVHRLCGS
jgi:hypothetical protein